MPEEFIAGYAITFDEHLQGSHDQSTHGNKFGTNDKGEKVLTYKGGTGGWKKSGKTANKASPAPKAERAFTTDALAGMTLKEKEAFLAQSGNAAWLKSMPIPQQNALSIYSGSAFAEINGGLRDGTALRPFFTNLIATANKALLANSAPADMIVSRGVSADFYNTLASHVGGTFVDKGFTSTTIDPVSMADFGTTQLTIKVFKGSPGGYIAPTSHYSEEAEWLTPSGSHFAVTQAYTSGGVNHVVMEYRGQPHITTPVTASWHIPTITEANPKPTPASRSNKFIWQAGDVQWLTPPKKGNS